MNNIEYLSTSINSLNETSNHCCLLLLHRILSYYPVITGVKFVCQQRLQGVGGLVVELPTFFVY